MKICIVSCVFPPEPLVSAQTSMQIAEELASLGHQIKVLAPAPSRPWGHDYSQYKYSVLPNLSSRQNFEVYRCFSFFSSVSTLSSRFLENISFGVSVFFMLLILPRFDVVYGNTWPIFAQGLLMLACRLRGTPLVLSVQDLYPESLLAQKRGIEKTSLLYSLLRWLDLQTARHCAGLVVISERFKDIYVKDRGIAEEKVAVVPNWIDASQNVANPLRDKIRNMHHVPSDAFLVIYGGNIGAAAGVEKIIDAFQHLLDDEHIYLLLAGGGNSLSNCFELIRNHRLTRVKVHSPWYASETYGLLSAADLCVLPTQGEQSLVSVPSKLLSYMLAGRCILALASSESETARVITASQSGWVISVGDSSSLAEYISNISKLPPDERNRRGEAGGNFVHKHFSSSENLPKMVRILVQHGKRNEKNPPYAAG